MANRRVTYEVGFTGDTSQLQASLRAAVSSLQELAKGPHTLQQGLNGAAEAALSLEQHLRNAYNTSTGKLDLSKLQQSLKQSGTTLQDYAAKLSSVGIDGKLAFMQVAQSITAAELPLKRSNQLASQLWTTLKNTARWRLTTGVINTLIGGVQTAYGYAKSLDASLNDIRIVTGKSADEMSRFAKEANAAAKSLSTTTTDYTDASLIYYQQGLPDREVAARTDTTIKMANVTGQSAETISDQMTAVWNNFDNGTRSLESFADSMVALGASTATSSKEIAEGLEKFAPVADAIGLSFDYAAAALTTITATTRESASVAGTALRTLFSRLEGLQLGETLDDGTDLNKYSNALLAVGVNIKDVNGDLKDMDTILDELGARWQNLARDEQMALAETVAGVRQYTQLIALMDSWDFFQENLATSRGSEGALQEQADIFAESWEAARNRVRAAAEDIYDSIINPQAFIDLDDLFTPFLTTIARVVDAMGGLKGILATLPGIMTMVFGPQIQQSLRDMALNIGLMTKSEQARTRAFQQSAVEIMKTIGLQEEDNASINNTMRMMQQRAQLQSELNIKMDSMTPYQQEQIRLGLSFVDIQQQQIQKENEKLAVLEEEIRDQEAVLSAQARYEGRRQTPSTFQPGTMIEEAGTSTLERLKKQIEDFQANFNKVKVKIEVDEQDAQKTFTSILENYKQIAARAKELTPFSGQIQQALSAETTAIEGESAALERMKQVLIQTGTATQEQIDGWMQSGNGAEILRAKVQQLSDELEQSGGASSALVEMLKTLVPDATVAQVDNLIRELDKLGLLTDRLQKDLEKWRQSLAEVGKMQPKLAPKDWTDNVLALGRAFTSVSMAIQSIKNLGEIFSDEEMSKSEKFTRVLTTLGMLIPSLISIFNLFSASLKANAGAKAMAAVGAKAMAAAEVEAIATSEGLALAVNSILGPIGILITLLGIAIVVASTFGNTSERAAEKMRKATEAYQESTDTLKSYEDEQKNVKEQLEELEELKLNGEITEQQLKELQNLRDQNAELEKQIELQKILNEEAWQDKWEKAQSTPISLRVGNAIDNDPSYYKRYESVLDTTGVDWRQGLIQETINATGSWFVNDQGIWEQAPGETISVPKLSVTLQSLQDWHERVVAELQATGDDTGVALQYIENIYTTYQNKLTVANKETIELLEEQYKTYFEALERDEISAQSPKFQEALIAIQQVRKAIYGERYGETFIEPFLRDLGKLTSTDFEALYKGNGLLSQDLLRQILSRGLSVQEVKNAAQEVYQEVASYLDGFGLGDAVDQFSQKELDFILAFKEEWGDAATFKDLYEYLKTNSGVLPISLQIEGIEEASKTALEKLISGDLLSDEDIAAFQNAYAGSGLEAPNLGAMSVAEQIDALIESANNLDDAFVKRLNDSIRDYGEQLNAVTIEIEELRAVQRSASEDEGIVDQHSLDTLKKYGVEAKNLSATLKKLDSMKIQIECDLDDAEKELQSLKDNFTKSPWEIEVQAKLDSAMGIAAQVQNIREAISLINDDLSVSANNLVELSQRYPEALKDAYYSAAENALYINQEMYDSMIENADGYLDRIRDNSAQELTDALNKAIGLMDIASTAEQAMRSENDTTLQEKIANDKSSAESARVLAFEMMLQALISESERRSQSITTTNQQQSDMAAAATNSGDNAKVMADNYASAATEIVRVFDEAFSRIASAASSLANTVNSALPEGETALQVADYAGADTSAITANVSVSPGVTGSSESGSGANGQTSGANDQTKTKEQIEAEKFNDFITEVIETGVNGDWSSDAMRGAWQALSQEIIDALPPTIVTMIEDALESGKFGSNLESLSEALGDPTNAPYLSDVQDATSNAINALTNRLADLLGNIGKSGSGGKGGGGGGGGKGSDSGEKEKAPDSASPTAADTESFAKELDEVIDRYHVINRQLERQDRILTMIEHQIDRTYGLDRLKLYEKQQDALSKKADQYKTKLQEGERWLEKDTEALTKSMSGQGKAVDDFQDALKSFKNKNGTSPRMIAGVTEYFNKIVQGYSFTIDEETREIANYDELMEEFWTDYNNYADAYQEKMFELEASNERLSKMQDALKDVEDGAANAQLAAIAAQINGNNRIIEQLKLEKEFIEDLKDERLDDIATREKTIDELNSTFHKLEDTLRESEDKKLSDIEYRLEVILDVQDAREQIRSFSKEIAESFGDALTHGAQSASFGYDQVRDEMAMYKEYVQQYKDLRAFLDQANDYSDTPRAIEDLKDLEGNIISSGQTILEWLESIEDMFVEALEAAADRFSYFTSRLEHNSSVLSSIRELYALQGVTYKTQEGFDRLQKTAQARLDTAVAQSALQRKWYEEANSKLQEAQSELDKLIAEEGANAEQNVMYDTLVKNRDALLEQQQEAQEAMLEKAQEAMEIARDMYLEQLERIAYEFDQAVSGGLGLSYLQDSVEHYIDVENRYLDDVNEAYEVAAWYSKLQTDIDNTNSARMKERLKDLQQQIDLRREGNTLSQYDLDSLEAQYEILKATMDLEEARNNKNELRLVRDSQGNWNYQYTANTDDIVEKQQTLLDKEVEWYNLAKEYMEEKSQEMLQIQQERIEKTKEIFADEANWVYNEQNERIRLTEEAQQKIAEIEEYYAQKTAAVNEEFLDAERDYTVATQEAMIDIALTGGERVADITGLTSEAISDLIEITGLNTQELLIEDFDGINSILNEKFEELAERFNIDSNTLRDILGSNDGLIDQLDRDGQSILENADQATIVLYNKFRTNWGLIEGLTGNTMASIIAGSEDTNRAIGVWDTTYATGLSHMTQNTDTYEREFSKAINKMDQSFYDYGAIVSGVANDTGTSLDELDSDVEDVTYASNDLYYAGLYAAEALWEQADAAQDAQWEYADLAQEIWECVRAMEELASASIVPDISAFSGVDTFDWDDWDTDSDEWFTKEMDRPGPGPIEIDEDPSRNAAEEKIDTFTINDSSTSTTTPSANQQLLDLAKKNFEPDTSQLTPAYKESTITTRTVVEKQYNLPVGYYPYMSGTGYPAAYSSGGYTGEFDGGKMAILHEKELVLNQEDTENVLAAVETAQIFANIAKQLDNDGLAAMALLSQRFSGVSALSAEAQTLEQHVTIENVSFPGVTSSREIEEAFENLVNDAAQWARRRKN